jgi:transposase
MSYELQQRLAQRDDLFNLRQQVRNQLHALDQYPEVIKAVRARMESLFSTFQAQIDEVEVEIAAALNQDLAWAAAAERLQNIKGIGWVTAAWSLVTTLNFIITCDTVDSLTQPMPGWHRCPGNPARVFGIGPRLDIVVMAACEPLITWRV